MESKISWSSTMIYLTDTERIKEWTRSLKWDSHQKVTKLFTTKTYRSDADPPEKRLNHWTRPYAQTGDYHGLTLLKTCKSYFCTDKTQQKFTSPCGSQEKQHPDCRWTCQQYSPIQHFVRRSTTLGREISIQQTWLLSSLSLFADGRLTISGNACFHFC